ncbi:MAG: AglZ/HisF2 family acetamidino modification protein [Ginsengibacter sp.]
MNLIRVIPTLLLKGEGLVKTQQFKNPVYIGDPINAVKIFNEKEVDELVLLDITATAEKRDPKYTWIGDIVSESFMPIGYGGGVKNIEQAKKLFDTGIEKLIINTASLNNELISSLAAIYGSQSIVVCIDVRKNLLGKYQVYTNAGTEKHKISPDIMAKTVVEAGAGEIIIQSIDREGTMKGYDLDLIKMVSEIVNVPVVASGGAGTQDHLREAIQIGGASSVTAGSMFVFKGKHRGILINYPTSNDLKNLFK